MASQYRSAWDHSGFSPEHDIHGLLRSKAGTNSKSIAISAPNRDPLDYADLLEQVDYVVAALNRLGIGRTDRVAIVLPNGPDMATAFLGVSALATSAPLNPAYAAGEFETLLVGLDAKALIVQAGIESPSVAVANKLKIPIIQLRPAQEAGIFDLSGPRGVSRDGGLAHPEDVALVLHTSGTTSRPKVVPLTHRNLCASAHAIKTTLDLTEDDRCLGVMPLFHIHGLIGGLLSSLAAGASVICSSGFDASNFFDQLIEFRPTWYTAVPTIHHAVLAGSKGNGEICAGSSLRFIRSASSALSSKLMNGLEDAFGVPVIEAYGMTEAAHQIASNPLPPLARKPGSVGFAAGPEVAIMNEPGELLPNGETGEVVIRGENVTTGYANDPDANATSFRHGWFRTGDQGYLDGEGYLYLTGRLKEIINRSGEKISPREIDDVIMQHPAVREAVTFGVPHPTLGEDVAVAVLLADRATATELEIRHFAASRLAEFKVPRRVIILDELPEGATGKVQRIGLAERLNLTGRRPRGRFVGPRDALESRLVEIWKRVLRLERVGVTDDFFDLGGNSVLAAQLVTKIAEAFADGQSAAVMLQAATIEQQAELLREGRTLGSSSIVPIQPQGSMSPLFCVHEVGGYLYYRDLARHLGMNQPLYGLQPRGLDGRRMLHTRIEDMAAHYAAEIRRLQSAGPYFLAGFSFGGVVAFEIARQLAAARSEVALLALFDAYAPGYKRPPPQSTRREITVRRESPWQRCRRHWRTIQRIALGEKSRYVFTRAKTLITQRSRTLIHQVTEQAARRTWKVAYRLHVAMGRPFPQAYRYVAEASREALEAYAPGAYPGKITLFWSTDGAGDPALGWARFAGGGLDIHEILGNHRAIVREPAVKVLAEKLTLCLENARCGQVGQDRARNGDHG